MLHMTISCKTWDILTFTVFIWPPFGKYSSKHNNQFLPLQHIHIPFNFQNDTLSISWGINEFVKTQNGIVGVIK